MIAALIFMALALGATCGTLAYSVQAHRAQITDLIEQHREDRRQMLTAIMAGQLGGPAQNYAGLIRAEHGTPAPTPPREDPPEPPFEGS